MSDMSGSGARPHACGGTLHLTEEAGTFRVHGTDVPVTHRFWRCDGCAEELVTEELAETVEKEAAAAYRRMERRLSGAEIRAIRERYGLTQEHLERALGLAPKTVARWESERVMPTRSTDNLLRVIDRDCGALIHLAKLHDVELPESCIARTRQIIDGRNWPRSLLTRLEAAAERQETDVNLLLIMVLTQYLSECAATPGDALYRSTYGSTGPEEPWLRNPWDVMRATPEGSSAA